MNQNRIQSVLILLTCLFWGGQVQGQAIQAFRVAGSNTESLLDQIANHAQLTIGLEEVVSNSSSAPESFEFEGGTVAELKKAFLRTHPQYAWSDLGPRSVLVYQRSPELAAIAKTVIHLQGRGEKSRAQVWNELIKDSGYTATLRALGCTGLNIVSGQEWRRDEQVSIAALANDATLDVALEFMATSSGRRRWGIEQRTQAGCQISLRLW